MNLRSNFLSLSLKRSPLYHKEIPFAFHSFAPCILQQNFILSLNGNEISKLQITILFFFSKEPRLSLWSIFCLTRMIIIIPLPRPPLKKPCPYDSPLKKCPYDPLSPCLRHSHDHGCPPPHGPFLTKNEFPLPSCIHFDKKHCWTWSQSCYLRGMA